MIKISREFIARIRSAKCGPDLHTYLARAIQLEHSTIPPYLTAMFSLKAGQNERIASLLHSVVVEEMLHMTIASNILIALGGSPAINAPDFVPSYPGPLPMNIGEGLIVGIEAFSIDLVKKVFMAIEEPEDPIPVSFSAGLEPEFATIGEFYDAIKEQIGALGSSIFTHKTSPPQVIDNNWFPPDQLFLIAGPEDACRAIDVIKLQGEGTSTNPFEGPDDPAHFYLFGEIAAGRKIVKTDTGFAYTGEPVPFDATGVWPLRANCKIADFAPGTQARTRIESFAYSYSSLLNALHNAFNGDPSRLASAIGLMYDLRVLAVALMQTDAGGGLMVGPSFEYVRGQGGMSNARAS